MTDHTALLTTPSSHLNKRCYLSLVFVLGMVTYLSQAQVSAASSDTPSYDTAPILIHQELAQSIHQKIGEFTKSSGHSDKAGVVVVSLTVNLQGLPGHIFIVRALGGHLDEEAVRVVQMDRFKPAMKDMRPISAPIDIELTFDQH